MPDHDEPQSGADSGAISGGGGGDCEVAVDHEPRPLPTPVVCPHCLTANTEFDNFCVKCAGPLTSHAAIGPLEHVFTLGHGYRGAVDHPVKRVTLIGMWLIMGPMVLGNAMVLAHMTAMLAGRPFDSPLIASDKRVILFPTDPKDQGKEAPFNVVTSEEFFSQFESRESGPNPAVDFNLWLGWLIGAGALVLQGMILWKVTRRYLRQPRAPEPLQDA